MEHKMENGDNNSNSSSGFGAMFDESFKQFNRLSPGDKTEARVVSISDDWIFLDIGRKGEGVLDKKEMVDKDGNLTVELGSKLTLFFLRASGGDMRFTSRLGKGENANAQLEDAYHKEIPIEGLVEKEIKGGFEVTIGKARAFCPFSQIALRRAENNEIYIGQRYNFMITEFSDKGRNIVVSRRSILKEEEENAREELKGTLNEGMVVKGRITSLQKFGAFINIGAIEGLLPISEISHQRVEKIEDVLTVGQEVEVSILSLNWEKNRHSFSLKSILADPWDSAVMNLKIGSVHTGVVRKLQTYGAFVSLVGGIDGLLHISKLGGGKRIQYPAQVLKEGQDLEVEIDSIDIETKRISLSIPGSDNTENDDDESSWQKDYKPVKEKKEDGIGSFGALLASKLNKKDK
jgi:small subunit ribosomal protein S1